MPSPFLTLKERVRLTCFPDAIPQWDLITYFTLTEHDGSLIATYQGETNRLGAALQLCAVRYLGFCPADLLTASSDVTTFLVYGNDSPENGPFGTLAKNPSFRPLQSAGQKAL